MDIVVPKLKANKIAAILVPRYVSVSIYGDENSCPWANSDEASKAYIAGVYLSGGKYMAKFELPIGKEIYVAASDNVSGQGCNQSLKFNPIKDAHYVLNITAHDSITSRCSSVLTRTDAGNETEVKDVKYAKPESIMLGLFEFEDVCEK